jgi:hypothetical protein
LWPRFPSNLSIEIRYGELGESAIPWLHNDEADSDAAPPRSRYQDILACLISGVPLWRSITTCWALLCSLPGTDVRVATKESRVLVRML